MIVLYEPLIPLHSPPLSHPLQGNPPLFGGMNG
jgi:hypothetical protein